MSIEDLDSREDKTPAQRGRGALRRTFATMKEAGVLRKTTHSRAADPSFVRETEFPAFIKGEAEDFAVHGMTQEERAAATLKWSEKKQCLVNINNNKAEDTGVRLYNVAIDGNLIIQPHYDYEKPFHHTSPTRDGALICAGSLIIENGKITNINNDSGHYRPELLDLYHAIISLRKQSNEIFDKNCTLEGSYGLPDEIKSLEQFMHYMTPSRVAELTEERIKKDTAIERSNITSYDSGPDFASAILEKRDMLFVRDSHEIYVHQFPKDFFPVEFQREYCEKHGVVMPENGQIPIRNITLTSTELFDILKSNPDHPKSIEAIGKLLATNTIKLSPDLVNDGLDSRVLNVLADEALKKPSDPQNLELLYHVVNSLALDSDYNKALCQKISGGLLSQEHAANTLSKLPPDISAKLYHSATEEIQKNILDNLTPRENYDLMMEIVKAPSLGSSPTQHSPAKQAADKILSDIPALDLGPNDRKLLLNSCSKEIKAQVLKSMVKSKPALNPASDLTAAVTAAKTLVAAAPKILPPIIKPKPGKPTTLAQDALAAGEAIQAKYGTTPHNTLPHGRNGSDLTKAPVIKVHG